MATPPPPKPKPGSLKDRIAAFESSKPAAPSPSAPALRPKPVTREWKPKPKAEDEAEEKERDSHKGMSATDAKETIKASGGLGSLKERMAALQGKGAFGSAAPAASPPVAPKPKPIVPRKPSVETPVVNTDETNKVDESSTEVPPEVDAPHASSGDVASPPEEKAESLDESQSVAESEVDEESQRRAAIAARMARLGGAKIGMAPPVFGRKPVSKKEEEAVASPEEKKDAQDGTAAQPQGIPIPGLVPPPAISTTPSSSSEKSQEETTYTSPTIVQSPDDSAVKSPTPSASSASSAKLTGPRRAAPPRKKKPTPQKAEEVAEPSPHPEEVELPPSRKTTESIEEDAVPSQTVDKESDPVEIELPPSRKTTLDPAISEEEPEHKGHDEETSPTTPQFSHGRHISLGPDVEESDVATPPPRSVTPSSTHGSVSDIDVGEEVHPSADLNEAEDTTPGEEGSHDLAEEPKSPPPPLPSSPRPALSERHASFHSKPDSPDDEGDETLVVEEDEKEDEERHENAHEDEGEDAVASHSHSEEELTPEKEELTPVHGSFSIEQPHDQDMKTVLPPPESEEGHVPELIPEPEEDEEEARKKRMREKMAKLGGFNPFGAPAPPPRRIASVENAEEPSPSASPPTRQEDTTPSITDTPATPARPDDASSEPTATENGTEQEPEQEVDEEAARKQRMRDKMAKLGGFNPFGAPGAAPPRRVGSGGTVVDPTPPLDEAEGDENDDEEARKERIRGKMSKMGGFNPFGGESHPSVPPRRASIPAPVPITLPEDGHGEDENNGETLSPQESEQVTYEEERPPPPPRRQATEEVPELEEEEQRPPPPPRRQATKEIPELEHQHEEGQPLPPPRRHVVEVSSEDDDDDDDDERPPPPPRRQATEEVPELEQQDEVAQPPPLPPPRRHVPEVEEEERTPPRRQATEEVLELEQQGEEEQPPTPPPPRRHVPEVEVDDDEEKPSPPPRRQATEEVPELEQQDGEERPPPPPPPRRHVSEVNPEVEEERPSPPPRRKSAQEILEMEEPEGRPPPPPRRQATPEISAAASHEDGSSMKYTESTVDSEDPEIVAHSHEGWSTTELTHDEHEDDDDDAVAEGYASYERDSQVDEEEDDDEMAPARITRPIPPLPPRFDSLVIGQIDEMETTPQALGFDTTTPTKRSTSPPLRRRIPVPSSSDSKVSASPASSVASLRSSSSTGKKTRPPVPTAPTRTASLTSQNPRRSIPVPPRGIQKGPPPSDQEIGKGHGGSLSILSIDLPPLSPSNQNEPGVHQPPLNDADVVENGAGDPIDPLFYSPKSPTPPALAASREVSPGPALTAQDSSSEQPTEEDEESARRRTIAERMARLGGIKFGAAPPMPRRQGTGSSPPSRSASNDNEEPQAEAELSEDAERARRQAIAARLAGQGGMRIGMGGMGMFSPPAPGGRAPFAVDESQSGLSTARPDQHEHSDSVSQSDDGVKVEAEESELEEVSRSEVVEAEAPPVPSRAPRPAVSPPRRPPVPVVSKPGDRKSSGGARATSPIRSTTSKATSVGATSDFVMVEPDAQPAPPPRPSRGPPSRAPPPPAPSGASRTQSTGESWELPSIPRVSLEFSSGDMDLSQSASTEWGVDSISYPQSTVPIAAAPAVAPAPRRQQPLTADELLVLWGRVGTLVHTAASTSYQKSSKSKSAIVGDGSFTGFVNAVLRQVPGAPPLLPHPSLGYGHLIYSQTGTSVTRRSADISPGDIILFENCHFHGRKGLQSYNITVGADGEDDTVGIINEIEAKKHKVKVFIANQHVGGTPIDNVSYRLEELKSGSVKVYRVPET